MTFRVGLWSALGGLIGGLGAGALAWMVLGNDADTLGDWRGSGARRFLGMAFAIGFFVGAFIAARLAHGPLRSRDGFTLSYPLIEPQASGYRELTTLAVADLLAALRAFGYEPHAEACDAVGKRAGTLEPATPLAGANVALVDPGVRGWLRLELPIPLERRERAMGLLELWSGRGDSTTEFAMFTLRALDGLIGGVAAVRESSRLSEDRVSALTAGLGDRPILRN